MNLIIFDTCIKRDAYRNGWDNCEPDDAGTGRWLSSTAHEGLLHVYPEGEMLVIIPTYQPICRVALGELAGKLQELSKTDTAPKGCPPLRTERLQMIKQRTAQHLYRSKLEKMWGNKCALTGLRIPELLRASHAKPWKDCTDAERVDPYNGFLFEARIDVLFDQGYISFDDGGELLISPLLGADEIRKLGLRDVAHHLPWVAAEHAPYLQWHRERVFRGKVES